MALGPFGRNRVGDVVGSETGGASAGETSRSEGAPLAGLSAFIDQGSEFEGKLSFKDTVRIDGRFLGEITSENTLVVGETGEIMAQIQSQTVIVSGHVAGNVIATRKLVLHKTARIEGDVQTGALVMEDGAQLNGRVSMTTAPRREGAPLKVVEPGA